MGYNFFNIVEVTKSLNKKLNDFRASLGEAIGRGKNISFIDTDLTYTLKLQHDRIQEMMIISSSLPATGRTDIMRAASVSMRPE